MNNPSPFNPQSSVGEQKNQSRARVRTAVTLVFAINFVALMTLLTIGFGCRKPTDAEVSAPETNNITMPPFETNSTPLPGTNLPATNTTAYVAPIPEPVAPVAPTAQEYVIVKGDYFEKIAKDHGVSTKAIQDANPGVDSKKLKIGQKIQIPAAAPAAASTSAPVVGDPASSGEPTYKVKSGDTLTTIGKHFGVSAKAIRSANNLTTDKIKVGDKLKIPAKSSSPAETAPASATTSPKSL